MSNIATCITFLIFINAAYGLQITNVTPPINLTNTFFSVEDSPFMTGITPGSMTYYIDPSDPSKQKYLYYAIWAFINKSSIISSYIESDIFTEAFTQYNDINNITDSLPFVIANTTELNEHHADIDGYHTVCTSPKTNDILSCWVHAKSNFIAYNYNIICKIYYSHTNTWSNNITITNNTQHINIIMNIVCFDDSYFIPHFEFDQVGGSSVGYGSFIDLKSNIIYDNIKLNITSTEGQILYTIKGSQNFDVSKLNNDATDSLMFYYTGYYQKINRTNITAVYAYYTNITDSQFPIYYYHQELINNNTIYLYEMDTFDSKSLNWTTDCCYISIYSIYSNYQNSDDIYAVFTDIHGRRINIANVADVGDILLAHNVSSAIYFVNYQIIDLSVISDEYTHYFMVMFGNYDSSIIIAGIYYLKYDSNANSFNLYKTGYFDTIHLPNDDYNNYDFDSVLCYVLPESNNLYCSWELYDYNGIGSESLFGQTFEIN